MAGAPIDAILDSIKWEEVTCAEKPKGKYATHQGVLTIEGYALRCYTLNDGTRVFDADDVESFFGYSPDGNKKA